jgi:hypothetical protein
MHREKIRFSPEIVKIQHAAAKYGGFIGFGLRLRAGTLFSSLQSRQLSILLREKKIGNALLQKDEISHVKTHNKWKRLLHSNMK